MTRLRRSASLLGLVLAGAVLTAPAAPAAPAGGDGLVLDHPVRGQAARTALAALDGTERAVVARRNGRSPAQLDRVLADPTAGLARDGRLFYAEQLDVAAARRAAAAEPTAPAAALSATDTFTLHSRAGSDRTIYLDFDGYTLPTSAAWNGGGIPAGTFDAFDERETSGTPTYDPAFTPTELAYVAAVWRVVAEKFSPFDVDVTTEDPGAAALDRSSADDLTYGTRAVFTDDRDARGSVCSYGSGGSGCAGIAWVDVFDDVETGGPAGYFEPAWIYTTVADFQLDPKQAGETAAHEVGHTLDLLHDTTTSQPNGYYDGHDDWYPLMGSSNREVGQWDDSTYPGAFTQQSVKSDIATITSSGLTTRPDDVPGTRALSAAAPYDGVIETREDTDTFVVDHTCTDPLTLTATGIGTGQTLDIGLRITAPGGAVTTVDQVTGGTLAALDASRTFATAPAGTWSVEVSGVGATANTNSTDYGSLGQYTLALTDPCPPASGTTPPGPPTGLTSAVAPRATTLDLGWTAPAVAGSPALDHYAVTLSGGGTTTSQDVSTTAASFTGLTPGTTYDVTVVAVSAEAVSTPLTATVRVLTWAPPTAPSVTASVAGPRATIAFAPAANPGGATRTGWSVALLRGTTPVGTTATLPAAATSWTSPGARGGQLPRGGDPGLHRRRPVDRARLAHLRDRARALRTGDPGPAQRRERATRLRHRALDGTGQQRRRRHHRLPGRGLPPRQPGPRRRHPGLDAAPGEHALLRLGADRGPLPVPGAGPQPDRLVVVLGGVGRGDRALTQRAAHHCSSAAVASSCDIGPLSRRRSSRNL